MAGHGWHCVSKRVVERKKCDCGKGEIIYYEEEWESDWAGDKTKESVEITCEDCKLKRIKRI